MKKKKMTIPIFVSHQGCPNDCVFCNQKRITGEFSTFDENKLRQKIDAYLASFLAVKIPASPNEEPCLGNENMEKPIEIAFFGGSFTGISQELQIKYLEIAAEYISKYKLEGIRISTRPDYIDDSIICFLKNYPVKAVEIGVQSLDDDVLKASNRGHTSNAALNAAKLINNAGFELGLQMMIGLPEDTLDKCIKTAKGIIEQKPDTVRIYPALVLKDTQLERMYLNGDFVPLDLEAAINWAAEILTFFKSAQIRVSRVGLQASDEISFDKGIVAGPFHPAFRQLVEEKILHDRVLEIYNKNNKNKLIIYANQKDYQSLIGHKRCFLNRIQNEKLNISFVLDNKKTENG